MMKGIRVFEKSCGECMGGLPVWCKRVSWKHPLSDMTSTVVELWKMGKPMNL